MKAIIVALSMISINAFAEDAGQPYFLRCFMHCGATENLNMEVTQLACASMRPAPGCFCGTPSDIADMMRANCH